MRRTAVLACLLALPIGCASAPPGMEHRPEIIIDIAQLRADAPEWQSALVDCSDSEFSCFEAPGRFLLAFPRSCPRTIGPEMQDWMVAGHRFRFTAPDAHDDLPTGGYVSDKYPHAYLLYRAGAGFTSL